MGSGGSEKQWEKHNKRKKENRMQNRESAVEGEEKWIVVME